LVLVLGIAKASLEILGIGIGVKKVVLLRSALYAFSYIYSMKTFSPLNIKGQQYFSLMGRKWG